MFFKTFRTIKYLFLKYNYFKKYSQGLINKRLANLLGEILLKHTESGQLHSR